MSRLFALVALMALAVAPAATAAKKSDVKLRGGSTTLALDAGTAKALTDNGFTLGVLPTTRSVDATTVAFPITTGRVDGKSLAGSIRHTGGLSLTKDGTTVSLRNFTIQIDAAPDITALVGEDRVSIADLDLSAAEITKSKRGVRVAQVEVTLSETAAGALNKAFGTTLFAKGLRLGEATVDARFSKSMSRKKSSS